MIFNKEKFRINLLEPKNKTDVAIGGPYRCLDCPRFHAGVYHRLLCHECYPKRVRAGQYIPPD